MTTKRLPHVLVIDDQFGRCSLGEEFRNSVEDSVFAAYQADRANLCRNYGLVAANEVNTASEHDFVACASFCPAQVWNNESKRIENSLESALDAVRAGWPFSDGKRWALVLLDLAFVYGELDIFGDPQERTLFGVDVILPALKREFGNDLPVVALSSTSKEENNDAIREAGALDFIQRIPGAGSPPDEAQKRLREIIFYHGLLEDDHAEIQSLSELKNLRKARRTGAGQ